MAFDEIQHPFTIKTLTKTGIEGPSLPKQRTFMKSSQLTPTQW